MTDTLRDRLARVLGPGNDDATAYAQADQVIIALGERGICEYPRWHNDEGTIIQLGPDIQLDTVTNRIWYLGDPFVQLGVEPYGGAE